MLSDRVSNPGPLTYESGALPIALRGPVNYHQLLTVGLLFNRPTTSISHLFMSDAFCCFLILVPTLSSLLRLL